MPRLATAPTPPDELEEEELEVDELPDPDLLAMPLPESLFGGVEGSLAAGSPAASLVVGLGVEDDEPPDTDLLAARSRPCRAEWSNVLFVFVSDFFFS